MFVMEKWHYMERNGWHGNAELCTQKDDSK